MPITLYLSRVPELLELDADRQIPDAWLRLDVLSQGLVSRYLARERGAPKSSGAPSSWVILRPFNPEDPRLYGVWNSKDPLGSRELESLRPISDRCRLGTTGFSADEHLLVKSLWPDVEEWTP